MSRTANDRNRTLITPEGIALSFRLASRGTRFGALAIDLIILLVVAIVVVIVLGFAEQGADRAMGVQPDKGGSPAGNFIAVFRIVLLFAMWYGYFLMFELGPRGATLGKRLTGIRIAARDGGRLSTEMVLVRNLMRDVEVFWPMIALLVSAFAGGATTWTMVAWMGVFVLFPFFNRDRLRAGDLVGGTWVIEAPRQKLEAALSTGQTAASGTSQTTGASYRFSDEELAVYGEYELQTLERVLREKRYEAMVAVHEAICRKIGWNPGAGDEQAFLEAYYTQLRGRLEAGMRMGKRKADKYAG